MQIELINRPKKPFYDSALDRCPGLQIELKNRPKKKPFYDTALDRCLGMQINRPKKPFYDSALDIYARVCK